MLRKMQVDLGLARARDPLEEDDVLGAGKDVVEGLLLLEIEGVGLLFFLFGEDETGLLLLADRELFGF